MTNLDSILKSRDITLLKKVHLVKAMVFPVVVYGCESLTVNKAEHQRIDGFELWYWRRLLKVSWTARIFNQWIVNKISPEYSLEGLMLKLKLQYFGHLMQKTDSFKKTLMLGKTEGRRRRGWHRMRWLGGITDSMDTSWVSSGSWWWTWKPGVLQSMGSQRVRHDWANWTELNSLLKFSLCSSILLPGSVSIFMTITLNSIGYIAYLLHLSFYWVLYCSFIENYSSIVQFYLIICVYLYVVGRCVCLLVLKKWPYIYTYVFPGGSDGKESSCIAGNLGWIPAKITWRRAWQPSPVFLPGESPWTEEPGGLQSMVWQRVRHDWVTKHTWDPAACSPLATRCSRIITYVSCVLPSLVVEPNAVGMLEDRTGPWPPMAAAGTELGMVDPQHSWLCGQ